VCRIFKYYIEHAYSQQCTLQPLPTGHGVPFTTSLAHLRRTHIVPSPSLLYRSIPHHSPNRVLVGLLDAPTRSQSRAHPLERRRTLSVCTNALLTLRSPTPAQVDLCVPHLLSNSSAGGSSRPTNTFSNSLVNLSSVGSSRGARRSPPRPPTQAQVDAFDSRTRPPFRLPTRVRSSQDADSLPGSSPLALVILLAKALSVPPSPVQMVSSTRLNAHRRRQPGHGTVYATHANPVFLNACPRTPNLTLTNRELVLSTSANMLIPKNRNSSTGPTFWMATAVLPTPRSPMRVWIVLTTCANVPVLAYSSMRPQVFPQVTWTWHLTRMTTVTRVLHVSQTRRSHAFAFFLYV
jgi:hypothetical protein